MGLASDLRSFAGTFFPWLNRRAELRARWGLPGDGDGARAGRYFNLTRKLSDRAAVVDDKTWSDLEFPTFFRALDISVTPIGRQYLFHQLRTYEFDQDELDRRHGAYEVLGAHRELREDIQLALKGLKIDSAAYMADLLLGPEPEKIPLQHLVVPCMLLAIIAIPVAIAHLAPLWLCAIPFLINMFIDRKVDLKLGLSVSALLDCGRMLAVANRIAAIRSDHGFPYLTRLGAEMPLRKELRSQIKSLAWLDSARNTNVISALAILANQFFLLRAALYGRSIERFLRTRTLWLSTFELIGAVDAAIAIAGFLHRYPQHCRPSLVSDPKIVIENGYHALIPQPVKNSITLAGSSALITGSNMTGKTTFIKMVAMNVILGHTLGVCLADRATLPRSPARALIRGDQSVETGKSRYFAEAEAIRDFIEEAAAGECRIFILDEPFSGTNTVERVAVAKAVLRAIGQSAQTLVTTHDVELQHLLGANFELFYFQEDPAVEGFFDHQLHAGASTQRNAIRVLERLGYPAPIIAEALATVAAVGKSP
jgi:DNA mismatch repair ATPase MutS